jgi:hypothetical protein
MNMNTRWLVRSIGHVVLSVGLWSTGVVAQDNTESWGTVGSAGTVQIGDQGKVDYDGPVISVKPDMSATIRYNVVAVHSIAQPQAGCGGVFLRIRYRDEYNPPAARPGVHVPLRGANNVRVELWQQNMSDGSRMPLSHFDSDSHGMMNGFQTGLSSLTSVTSLDFANNVYWVEVTLDNRHGRLVPRAPGLPPAVAGVQIQMGDCIN